MKIVTIENDELRLCSGMKEDSFGKTDYDSIVTQEGLVVKAQVSLETLATELNKNSFDSYSWSFEEIRSFPTETPANGNATDSNKTDTEYYVHYCGKNPDRKSTRLNSSHQV